jgi:hypothetical protein
MNDANKTALTHRVTAVAAAYLDGLGCKPVETEVEIRPGWIADVASYWYPSRTEAKRLHLHNRIRGRLFDEDKDDAALALRVYGHGPFTVAVEVKTTIGDFRSDRKWTQRPPAHVCIVAYPAKMLSQADLPDGWHGLETSPNGDKLRRIVRPLSPVNSQHPGPVLDFVAQVGIRRDHRTRQPALRAFWKALNAKDRERKRRYSVGRLLDSLASYIQGQDGCAESMDELLADWRVQRIPNYAQPAIEFFESLRARNEFPDVCDADRR